MFANISSQSELWICGRLFLWISFRPPQWMHLRTGLINYGSIDFPVLYVFSLNESWMSAVRQSVPGKIPGTRFFRQTPNTATGCSAVELGLHKSFSECYQKRSYVGCPLQIYDPLQFITMLFVIVNNNLNYRQRLDRVPLPRQAIIISLQRKQLAHNSSVYVQFLYNNMLLTGVRLNAPNHICNHVNATKLQPLTSLTQANMACLLILFALT